MRKTKIVATIGPASEKPEVLRLLIEAGMDVARLNFAHGTYEEHRERIKNTRRIASEFGKPVAILQDLPGPKLRIGELASEEGLVLEEGAIVNLILAEKAEKDIPIPIPPIFSALKEGNRVLLADGNIQLEVLKPGKERIECQVIAGGTLLSHQGINLPGVSLPISSITEEDIKHLNFGIDMGVDWVALSFVRSAKDIKRLRQLMLRRGDYIPIIAKIEKQEAVQNIEEICREADGIMVARGDLGLEIPLEEVPAQQKNIIRLANKLGKPCIVATQMLESMVRNPRPTRAEVTDVANAILDGADAVMLSEETTIGKYPVEAVKIMHRIAERTERFIEQRNFFAQRLSEKVESTTDAIAISACQIAENLSAKAIITVTSSGYTARMVSRYRPSIPIIAITPEQKTLRRLPLVWGVYPCFRPYYESTDEMLSNSIEAAKESGLVKDGDVVVLTGGVPIKVPGTTNLLKVHMIARTLATGKGFGEGTITGVLKWLKKEGQLVKGYIVAVEKVEEKLLPYLKEAKAILTREEGVQPYLLLTKAEIDVPLLTGIDVGEEVLKEGMVLTVDVDKGVVLEGETQVV
ncbi:pyruvate kinase [bacterium]|nr:pyruvate kinase [bacterium]